MTRPRFRIVCCLCGEPIPLASDVHALDKEWERRFPEMVGTLACENCAVRKHEWNCRTPGEGFVAGHIPAATQPADRDLDSWSHIGQSGTHVAMVVEHPWSGLLQGAEEYLRHAAQRPGVNPDVARRLQAVISEWDAMDRTPSTNVR